MRNIERLFVHCTAGKKSQTAEQVMAEFKRKKWKYPGYHYLITEDGKIHQLLAEDKVSNGVQGYNSTSINVAYTGGIDDSGKPLDTRTDAQKKSLYVLLKRLKEKYPEASIMGHRDISPDKNGNGKVDSWERIKACPCFDAITEYAQL